MSQDSCCEIWHTGSRNILWPNMLSIFYFRGSQFGIFIHIPPHKSVSFTPCMWSQWSIRRMQTVCIIMYITDLNFSVCLHHIKYMYMPTLAGQVSITSISLEPWELGFSLTNIQIYIIAISYSLASFLYCCSSHYRREAKTCVGLLLCYIIWTLDTLLSIIFYIGAVEWDIWWSVSATKYYE